MNIQSVQSWYEQYRVGIYRFALSILKDASLAEDVLQETFARLLQKGNFPFEPGMEKPWLYRVARNLCYDHLRRQKRELPGEYEAHTNSGLEFIELLAPLSKTEREIVSLKIVGNLTHREIAAVLHLTVHGTKKRYERAIQKLRSQMKEEL